METTTSDTRSRIQQVALDLFIEQGYDKTSLREIAEQLGVTKAALYYYFRSKEELINSFLDDRVTQLDTLIAWLKTQPQTSATRHALIKRYADELHSGAYRRIFRLFESNQAALKQLPAGHKLHDRFRALTAAMVDQHEPLADQLRTALALWALHTSWFVLPEDVSDEERQAAALEVALDLVSR